MKIKFFLLVISVLALSGCSLVGVPSNLDSDTGSSQAVEHTAVGVKLMPGVPASRVVIGLPKFEVGDGVRVTVDLPFTITHYGPDDRRLDYENNSDLLPTGNPNEFIGVISDMWVGVPEVRISFSNGPLDGLCQGESAWPHGFFPLDCPLAIEVTEGIRYEVEKIDATEALSNVSTEAVDPSEEATWNITWQ